MPNPMPHPTHPSWRAFMAGYDAGLAHGIDIGYRNAGHDWTAVTTLACRTARAAGDVTHAELQRRRSTYATPALTAEEIRTRAATSWGFPLPLPPTRCVAA